MEEENTTRVDRWSKNNHKWDGFDLNEDNQKEEWTSEVAKKRAKLESKKRGLIRSLVIILDLSANCLEGRSFGQDRIKLIQEQTKEFISDYFLQNPLSQLAILATYDSRCYPLSSLSSNAEDHRKVIESLSFKAYKGEASIESSLKVAMAILGSNGYGGLANFSSTKEVLMVYGSLNTCDVDPIDKTIEKIKSTGNRVSIIGLGAKIHVLERIAEATKGDYFVPISYDHFVDLMHSFVIPPETLGNQKKLMIPFGFAGISDSKSPAFDPFDMKANPPSETNKHDPKNGGYICPRCNTRVFQVPCFCPVCSDFLITPSYLKKTACHLDTIPEFEDVPLPAGMCCKGCNIRISGDHAKLCPKCGQYFCDTCDEFIHETLQVCPGCIELEASS